MTTLCCNVTSLRRCDLFTAYVFDVEQTDGEPLPVPGEASGDPGAKTTSLKAAVLGQGIALESVDNLDGCSPQ